MKKELVNYKNNWLWDLTVKDAEELENILEEDVFKEFNKDNGYKTNRVHAIVFNGRQAFVWMNNKRFIHMAVKNEDSTIDGLYINKKHELKYTNTWPDFKKLKSMAINLNVDHNPYEGKITYLN